MTCPYRSCTEAIFGATTARATGGSSATGWMRGSAPEPRPPPRTSGRSKDDDPMRTSILRWRREAVVALLNQRLHVHAVHEPDQRDGRGQVTPAGIGGPVGLATAGAGLGMQRLEPASAGTTWRRRQETRPGDRRPAERSNRGGMIARDRMVGTGRTARQREPGARWAQRPNARARIVFSAGSPWGRGRPAGRRRGS